MAITCASFRITLSRTRYMRGRGYTHRGHWDQSTCRGLPGKVWEARIKHLDLVVQPGGEQINHRFAPNKSKSSLAIPGSRNHSVECSKQRGSLPGSLIKDERGDPPRHCRSSKYGLLSEKCLRSDTSELSRGPIGLWSWTWSLPSCSDNASPWCCPFQLRHVLYTDNPGIFQGEENSSQLKIIDIKTNTISRQGNAHHPLSIIEHVHCEEMVGIGRLDWDSLGD